MSIESHAFGAPPPIHSDTAPLLEVSHLNVSLRNKAILRDISFNVHAKEIRAILGSSGGGKTTLLRTLMGLLPVSEGRIVMLGHDLAKLNDIERAQVYGKIGMLFQSGALLNSLSVADNVALPLREGTDLSPSLIDDMVAMKLAMVGLQSAQHLMPQQLSGGMKKRVALARAMACDPALLLCDEPSAGLDPNTAADIDQLLLHLREQFSMSMVVVTHDLDSIRTIADTVLMLFEGRILFDGTMAQLQQCDDPIVQAFLQRAAKQPQDEQPRVLDVLGKQKSGPLCS